jgi:Ca2+-binding RTX toxin-like protein
VARRLSLGVVLSALLAAPAAAQLPDDVCRLAPAGVKCQEGGGRTTEGGAAAGKVSHKGWPAVTGVIWVLDHNGRSGTGTVLNDELLGGHGSDELDGGPGKDILWGDMWPTQNNTWQRDRLVGGAGNDWLYASHGRNVVVGGPGRDTIWAYFAVRVRIRAGDGNDRIWAKHGTGHIDCGPGRDRVRVPLSGYSLSGCEIVRHYCAFGPDGHGGCNNGTRAVIAARRR